MKVRAVSYSVAEMAWLEANRMMVISDYHRAFVGEFTRPDVTQAQLHGLRKRKGWRIGPTAGRFKGRRQKFSSEEIAWLRDNARMVIGDYQRGFKAAFGHDMRVDALNSLRKREGFKTGRSGHFEPGHVSANKGKPCPPGKMGRSPNAQKTHFKKGQMPHNTRGPGHEWIDGPTGYVVMIVDEPNPWVPGQMTRPVHKHRWLWEQLNGPVPEGMVLKCLDSNKQNTDPANWELIERGLLPRLNGRFGLGYDTAEPEIKPVILTMAKLQHKAKAVRERKSA